MMQNLFNFSVRLSFLKAYFPKLPHFILLFYSLWVYIAYAGHLLLSTSAALLMLLSLALALRSPIAILWQSLLWGGIFYSVVLHESYLPGSCFLALVVSVLCLYFFVPKFWKQYVFTGFVLLTMALLSVGLALWQAQHLLALEQFLEMIHALLWGFVGVLLSYVVYQKFLQPSHRWYLTLCLVFLPCLAVYTPHRSGIPLLVQKKLKDLQVCRKTKIADGALHADCMSVLASLARTGLVDAQYTWSAALLLRNASLETLKEACPHGNPRYQMPDFLRDWVGLGVDLCYALSLEDSKAAQYLSTHRSHSALWRTAGDLWFRAGQGLYQINASVQAYRRSRALGDVFAIDDALMHLYHNGIHLDAVDLARWGMPNSQQWLQGSHVEAKAWQQYLAIAHYVDPKRLNTMLQGGRLVNRYENHARGYVWQAVSRRFQTVQVVLAIPPGLEPLSQIKLVGKFASNFQIDLYAENNLSMKTPIARSYCPEATNLPFLSLTKIENQQALASEDCREQWTSIALHVPTRADLQAQRWYLVLSGPFTLSQLSALGF